MQGISILILVLIEIMFTLITLSQKEKGAFTVGTFITIAILIPIVYILNN